MLKFSALILCLLSVLSPSTGKAALVTEDFENPGDELVTLDTLTGNRWIDVQATQVPDSFADDQITALAAHGYQLATPAQVCQFLTGNLSGFVSGCPTTLVNPPTYSDLTPVNRTDADLFVILVGFTDEPFPGQYVVSGRCGTSGPNVDCLAVVGTDFATQAGAGVFDLNQPSVGFSAYWFVKVPEPSTYAMLSVGIIGLWGFSRKRHRPVH